MSPAEKRENAVIDAALRLAAQRSWRDVRLADIAAEANLDLADLAPVGFSKADIVRRFSRRTDRAMLEALKAEPVEGEAHDRLFEVVMRRLEIMAPYKAGLASILEAPADHPTGWVMLAVSAASTQRWMLAAARLDEHGAGGFVKQNGLALVYARTLRTWLSDDDPGLARTMAALDRDLRSGAEWLRWAEVPITVCSALGAIGRGLWRARGPGRSAAPPPPPPPPAGGRTAGGPGA